MLFYAVVPKNYIKKSYFHERELKNGKCYDYRINLFYERNIYDGNHMKPYFKR